MKNNVLDNFEKLMKGDQNIVIKSTVFILKHLSETVWEKGYISLSIRLISFFSIFREKMN